jgi:SAM-dependent methyltransferase
MRQTFFHRLCLMCLCVAATTAGAQDYQPVMGQSGKDVVWVPTPDVMVEKMLDMAAVTPRDFVIDLGSGDGRNIIGAAKRGARGLGVEYNPDLVRLSRQRAAEAGVSSLAQFVEGDMYAADIANASVLMLFLVPENLRRLLPKFLELQPGTRIVSNTYEMPGWPATQSATVREDCRAFCIVFYYVVPAKVEGVWKMPDGELALDQEFQRVSGSYDFNGITLPVENGQLDGAEIHFTINRVEYRGVVDGDSMQGTAQGRSRSFEWRATRQ